MSDTVRALVTGMGVCLPMAESVGGLKRAILDGRDGMTGVDRFDASRFKGRIASMFPVSDDDDHAPAVLRPWAERTAFYAVRALREAKAHAGLAWSHYAPERVAVLLGTSNSGIERLEEIARAGTATGADPRKLAATSIAHVTNVVSVLTGARGPRVTFSSACASSTAAVGHAMDLIRDGRAEMVVVVGADCVSHGIMAGFNSLGALSESRTAPFSQPIGITLGEGAGAFIVENGASAGARGARAVAEIAGYALSGDAYHATSPDREGRGIEAAVRMALADAGLSAGEIDFVSAHGTGTEANDAAESQAMERLFGRSVPVSSSKSFLGHTLGASGIIEMIAAIAVAADGMIPPTANFSGPRPGCADLDYVPNAPRRHAVRRFVCNNYAFGGNNASTIIDLEPGKAALRDVASQPVAITGIGTVGAQGAGFAAFETGLDGGRGFEVRDEDADRPVARVRDFAFSDPRLKAFVRASPMVRYAIEAVNEAVDGLDAETAAGCGLVMGIVNAAQRNMERFLDSVSGDTPELASPQHFSMTTMNAIGGQVAIAHRLKGYSTSLAGSWSAAAYGHALVRRGRQQRVVVAGCDEVTEGLLGLYAAMTGLDGAHHGEGAAALMLESLEAAQDRGAAVLAVIAAVAETQDPRLAGGRRDGDGLARAARQCLADAGLGAADIGAVVAASAWTARSQAAQRAALAAVFGARVPPVRSVTGQTGFLPAAGPLLDISAAVALLRADDRLKHVLVTGSDVTGPHAALVVSRPPAAASNRRTP